MMKRDSDQILTEWLVLCAQTGDADALDALLRRIYPRFLRYAERETGSRDGAKDVVQEALIVIARKISRLRSAAAFHGWAQQIVYRRCADFHRNNYRKMEREQADLNPDAHAIGEGAASDDNESLLAAIHRLDAVSKTMIEMFYHYGMSVREIASACDVPQGTIKSRLHTARGKLRLMMEEAL